MKTNGVLILTTLLFACGSTCVRIRHVVAVYLTSRSRAEPGHVDQVLESDWHARQGAQGFAPGDGFVHGAGAFERSLAIQRDPGIQRGADFFRPPEKGLCGLDGR